MRYTTNKRLSFVSEVKNALQKNINTLPIEDRDLHVVAMIEGIAGFFAAEAVSHANKTGGDLPDAEHRVDEYFNVMRSFIEHEFVKYYRD